MYDCNFLHKQLEAFAKSHVQLETHFRAFANFVQLQLTDPKFHIKGFTVICDLENSYFDVCFAGRKLRFSFSTPLAEKGGMNGKVVCELLSFQFGKDSEIVGKFTFLGNAKSNLTDSENGDPVFIDNDLAALYVALEFVYRALSSREADQRGT